MDPNEQTKTFLRGPNTAAMDDEGKADNIKDRAVNFCKERLSVILLIVVIVMFTVIIIISVHIKVAIPGKNEKECVEREYTKCLDVNTWKTCFDTPLDSTKPCMCNVPLDLTYGLRGNVTLYYELTTFDQNEANYSRSRDDVQLSGHITQNVSLDCGKYAIGTSGKPIAPCGLVADSMFTDSYQLQFDNEVVPVVIPTGLVNKTGFQNPPANLAEVFRDFKKPINWVKNVWELDSENPDNNGFQNEAFIAWMREDLKRKPVMLFKHGMQSGQYLIRINYVYPLNRYNGSRVLFICAEEDCKRVDYTNCINIDKQSQTCFETLSLGIKTWCTCYQELTLTHNLTGNVIIKYELSSYNQTIYSSSRDDDQLSGKLSLSPSKNCEPYAYNNGTPIAPCGLMADSMFNDSYAISMNNRFLNYETTGLVDKTGFINPPANLVYAFKDFDKPKSWTKNLWELDPENPDNNGFQNEAFVAWMRTDLKQKPVWRLNMTGRYKDGLPKGSYNILTSYTYPVSRYNGTRMIMVCGEIHIPDEVYIRTGLVILLVICIIILAIVVSYLFVKFWPFHRESST